MPRFTPLNARENALRSVASRRAAEALPDLFSLNVARACDETLELLRHAKKPSEKAQLSRALRDLREVWHLATGKHRPGLTRPEQGRTPRREIPRVYPQGCSLDSPSAIS